LKNKLIIIIGLVLLLSGCQETLNYKIVRNIPDQENHVEYIYVTVENPDSVSEENVLTISKDITNTYLKNEETDWAWIFFNHNKEYANKQGSYTIGRTEWRNGKYQVKMQSEAMKKLLLNSDS
jgi:hypothetical protein